MATVNKRAGLPQAIVINGVDTGGTMTIAIQAGYDNIMPSNSDGFEVPVKDKEIQFVRGTITTQAWTLALDILTGTVGTYIFYERKSGVAAATGYIKHTITNPVVYGFNIGLNQAGYATATLTFECKAADETEGIAAMWAMTDTQAAPTAIIDAKGGYRIKTTVHGAVSIYHVTAFSFGISMPLDKACNDGDVGYTAVDARLSELVCNGSLSFQDAEITSSKLKAMDLVLASPASLVLNVAQGQGAADKVITIARADFDNLGSNADAKSPYSGYTLPFDVANDTGTPLTLAGDNKILTIANAA